MLVTLEELFNTSIFVTSAGVGLIGVATTARENVGLVTVPSCVNTWKITALCHVRIVVEFFTTISVSLDTRTLNFILGRGLYAK